jgi:uncharacterized repeat protein (TIGR01451 family)
MRLLGSNPDPQMTALDQLPGRSNYLIGNDRKKWRTDVPHYSRVLYRDVFPDIDLIYYGNQRQLEFDFIVNRGGDPTRIRVSFWGGRKLEIDAAGDLIVRLDDAEVRFHQPIVYQPTSENETGKHFLHGRYLLTGEREVGFQVSGYDRSKALVIDPVLSYSTLLGGSDLDAGNGIAVDSTGSAYVTGETASTNFPRMGPYQDRNIGGYDVFVTKLDPSGTNLVYSTYLGGTADERGNSIAVDSAGRASVTGRTNSDDFPLSNPWQTQRFGDFDAFVSELNPQGNALVFSTYLGGSGNDEGSGIAVDASGKIYVTGGAGVGSRDDFPTTQGAFQRVFGGGLNDAFVTKFDPAQSGSFALVYSTFLGGGDAERGNSIAVDSAGNAYVTGRTASSADFPLQNPLQPGYGGGQFDAFVTELNATATALIYSTYLGDSGLDQGYGIALDSVGNAYVTGQTYSSNFPTMNAYQTSNAGGSDAFVAEVSATGSSLVYSTYFGGSGDDVGSGIAVDSSGITYLTGRTSTTVGFPTTPDAVQPAFGGGPNDAFIAKIDPSRSGLASLVYSSYLGGSGDEDMPAIGVAGNPSGAIAVDASGNAYITGNTASTDFPLANPYQTTYGGGISDAFVARLSGSTASPDFTVSATPASVTVSPGGAAAYTVTVGPSSGFTGSIDLSIAGFPDASAAGFNPPTIAITDTNPQMSTLTVNTSSSTPSGTFRLSITGMSGQLQHTTSVTLMVTSGTDTADLSLTKTGSPNPVAVQTNLTYIIRVTNLGPSGATGVQVTDTLPNVTFVSATATQGTCAGTSTVTCGIGSLDVGARATITIVVTPPAIGSISNTATVTGDQPDPNPNNNSATAVTPVVVVGGVPVDVFQHHLHSTRDALYVDPLITQAASMTAHRDLSFDGSLTGQEIHAQPLYVNNGPNGAAAFVVATEQNNVVVLDAGDGSQIWTTNLGAPVPRATLPCGDIDPLGITGTPVIDPEARVVFLDAMTTPDGGATKQHVIYALSLDDGSVIAGWPVDVNTMSFGGLTFDSNVQNQRGALLLNAGVLYVPYAGHFGDCGTYHGWVVRVPENDPAGATSWATDGLKAGIWAVGGLTTDGSSVFAATGNTSGATDWMGGEAILRLGLDGTFSHNQADFFTPSNWFTLDQGDLDLGGEAPLIVDVPGATPSQLVVALGKSGVAHLLDRNNLGGIGGGDGVNGEGLFSTKVATETDPRQGRIRTAAATYTTASGTYVVFSVSTPGATGFGCPGTPGDLVSLLITPSNPPTISVAWCADNHGRGAPIVTTTDGSSEPVVWTIGACDTVTGCAAGSNRLYAYNGETGDPLFTGGGPDEQMTLVQRFSTPIAVNGRIVVAAGGRLFVFTTQ